MATYPTNEDLAREAERLALEAKTFLAKIDADMCGLNAAYAPLGVPILVYSEDDRCWVAAERKSYPNGGFCFWPIPISYESDEIYNVKAYLPMLPKPANAKK